VSVSITAEQNILFRRGAFAHGFKGMVPAKPKMKMLWRSRTFFFAQVLAPWASKQ